MRKETVEKFLRAAKRGIRGRQRLLAPLVGLGMLAASCNPLADITQLSHSSSFLPETTVAFDYCKPIDEDSSLVERSLIDVENRWRQVTPDTEDGGYDIDKINITTASFVRNKIPDKTRLQIALVPVWYAENESDQRMEYIADILKKAYFGINVEFSYLNKPVKLGVKAIQHRAILSDIPKANRLIEKVQKVYPASKLVFVINTSEYIG